MSRRRMPSLYIQVLIAVALGIALGYAAPETAAKTQIISDIFIKLIKMLIAPIIFCTVVSGVGNMGDMRQAGRVGIKALGYFIVLSGVSLLMGLFAANWLQPGAGLKASAPASTLSTMHTAPLPHSFGEFVMHVIPETIASPLVSGDTLQVLFVALLFAAALMVLGNKVRVFKQGIEDVGELLFVMIGFVTKLAPLAAFGAMASTIGHYGAEALLPLIKLVATFYGTCILFVLVVLGGVLRWAGLNIFQFLLYIRDELLIVFGTSSSETVLPRMLAKLEALGCERPVVDMVLPTGYSFNLDGTALYLTLAAIFLAQATGNPLSFGDELVLLGVMMLASKGAAGVTGAGFAVLAASIGAVGHIPAESLALIIGVDRFMSTGRALTNMVGNGVATVVLARWEKALDLPKARAVLAGKRKVVLENL